MQVSGKFTVRAPPQAVWDSFWNPATLPAWVPGCTGAAIRDDGTIAAVVEQSVAFLKSRFELELRATERVEPSRLVISGGGRDPKIASQVKLTMTLEMRPAGDGTVTDVAYQADVSVFGRVATIGHFVIQAKAREMEAAFVQRVKAILEQGADAAPDPFPRSG